LSPSKSALRSFLEAAIISLAKSLIDKEGWMGIVLRNITAVIDGATAVKTVNLRIDGKRISTISEDPLPINPGETVIEGEGKLAIPGLVNAHSHLPMVLFRGLADDLPLRTWLEDHIWPVERELSPKDVYWASLLGLAEMIRAGTTMCADMYFYTNEVGRAVEEVGLRAVLSYGVVAPEFDAHGKAELKKAEAVITRWEGAGDGRIKTALSPHAIYTCGEEVWKAAIELAQKYEVILHTHLAETREEVEQCRAQRGLSPVATLDRFGALSIPVLAAHCVHVDKDDIHLLADREVSVVHCPKSNAKLGSGIAPIVAMQKAGVTVALGTDGAAANNSLDMIEEMRMAALLQKVSSEDPTVLPAREVALMATQAGAKALRTGAQGLAVGQDADIVLVDLDCVRTLPIYDPLSALVYAAHSQDITDVMVAGRFLLRDRELVTIDEEKVKQEVKRLSKRYIN